MPDLNSVPASPHSLANSRRASSNQMPPPPIPSSPSLNILPSNQSTVNQASNLPPAPALVSGLGPTPQPALPPASNDIGVVSGPGPLRHPRPLTAADLHMQLEKEQEAVVNRLTRELQLLRTAQNASVVSNTSSTSTSNAGTEPPGDTHLLSGAGFSIPSSSQRHHRSPSNTSIRSVTAIAGSGAISTTSGPRPANPVSMSRQNSTTSRRSQTSSPAPQHLQANDSSLNYFQQQRFPPAPIPVPSATAGNHGVSEQLSPGLMPATTRYEETAFYRSELEAAKRENEILKRRIRELERTMRERRASDASRTRSESVSTTASASVAPAGGAGITRPRDIRSERPGERERGMTTQSNHSVAGSVGVGVPEEEVRVGESAASAGLRSQERHSQT